MNKGKMLQRALTSQQQQVFTLRQQGLTFGAIAKEIGTSVGTVFQQYHRAKAKSGFDEGLLLTRALVNSMPERDIDPLQEWIEYGSSIKSSEPIDE